MLDALRYSSAFCVARRYMAGKPWVYFPMARVLGNHQLMKRETDIVIDGFPRCGNSYAEAAFLYSQRGHPHVLASHAHAGAQIIAAVRRGIPTIVLYRHPDDAVASFLEMIDARRSPASIYGDFEAYYRSIEPYQDAFMLAEFKLCISDFSAVLSRANMKFGTRFKIPQIGDTFHRNVNIWQDEISLERVGRVTRNSERNDPRFRKLRSERRVAARIEVEKLSDHPSRIAATRIYETFRSLDVRMRP